MLELCGGFQFGRKRRVLARIGRGPSHRLPIDHEVVLGAISGRPHEDDEPHDLRKGLAQPLELGGGELQRCVVDPGALHRQQGGLREEPGE